MWIQMTRQRLLAIKDTVQGTMYAFLAHKPLYTAMSSVLAFFLRPILSLSLISLAFIQLYAFIYSPNKNIDGWMVTLGSLVSAILNNISAFGSLLMRLNGQTFLMAPWLLVAGFGLSASYRFILSALHLQRALESPLHSVQRQHFFQAASFNLITAIQLTSCTAAIIVFNLFPASTLLVSCIALTVVGLNMASLYWRTMGNKEKEQVKNYVGLAKPVDDLSDSCCKMSALSCARSHNPRLFSTHDHLAIIKKMSAEESRHYLTNTIQDKLSLIGEPHDEKMHQKKAVLQRGLHCIEQGISSMNKKNLRSEYPLSLNNFWCEKSDTEQLIDAVIHHSKQKTELYHEMPGRAASS